MLPLFNIRTYRPPDEAPTRAASNWLLLSVACAVAPHAMRLPLWLTLTVAVGLIWRFGVDNHAWRVPPRWVQWILLAAVVVGILKTYGTFLGRDAGVAFLTVAVGLKVLEIRRLRDYLITVFLTFFLVVGAFLYSQSMMTAVYGAAVALLTTATLALLNNAQGFSGLQVWKLLGRIVLFGLPICLVMYVFFPRIQGSLWGLPSDAFSRTGMTDEVRPGSFSNLSISTSPAFRVEFQGTPPEPKDRYWRVYVLSTNQDGAWRRRTIGAFDGPQPGGFDGTGPPVTYTVTLEPHNEYWLPALDLPVDVPEEGVPRHGFLVGSRRRVTRVVRYTMSSQQVASTAPLNLLEHQGNLRMEAEPSPRVADLLRRWRDLPPSDKVSAALTYFREQPFRYTLTPPKLEGEHRVDQFLFETRAGYCEHYASAFVSLMRWSGVPARLLAGYQGGEWNESGGYLTVYQSDAHAWAEVWLPERGWTRVDPTAAVAPERIELGAEAIRLLVERGAAPGQLTDSEIRRLIARSWFQRKWLQTRWAWDNINYLWNIWVMGYGPEMQRGFLRWLGFETPTWSNMVAALAAGVAALLLIAGIVITRQRVREDPVVRLYRRVLRKLAKSGLIKDPTEGPYDFQRRVECHEPELARRLKPVTEMYVGLRYADNPSYTTNAFKTLVARF